MFTGLFCLNNAIIIIPCQKNVTISTSHTEEGTVCFKFYFLVVHTQFAVEKIESCIELLFMAKTVIKYRAITH